MSADQRQLPRFRSIAVPSNYDGHRLLDGLPFYTIPQDLLEQVVKEVGIQRFDNELMEMEFELSEICGDHADNIGFWGHRPIDFKLLRPGHFDNYSSEQVAHLAGALGTSVDSVQATLSLVDSRYQRLTDVRRGYCGWLMTNRQFLSEHEEIFARWSDEIFSDGVPIMGPALRDASDFPGGADVATGLCAKFVAAFEQFFVRWRLDGMPAPFAPSPLAPQLPVVDLRPVLGHMRHGGTTFYFPDIAPVPSRDELRDILEEALRCGNVPEHLEEWSHVVQATNPSRKQITRYGRVFEVQHYVRTLYGRHAESLHRKKAAVIRALSAFLSVGENSIAGDWDLITGRLASNNWHLSLAGD